MYTSLLYPQKQSISFVTFIHFLTHFKVVVFLFVFFTDFAL